MIKAIFFDLDGTIRHNLPSGGEVFAAQARRLGLPASLEDQLRSMRWEHYYWANSAELLEDRQQIDADVSAFWMRYSERRLVAMGATRVRAQELAPQINAYMTESYKPDSVVPPDALHALQELAKRKLPMAVISNRDKPYEDELAALGLSQFFAFGLAGGEIDAFKPHPRIFLHACDRLGVLPVESAYVGDNYFADVNGARRAGLTPVLYDPSGIFPDPGCLSIKSFDELAPVLGL
jgi:HAD superfamily hydrolase (TIGR01549 family)